MSERDEMRALTAAHGCGGECEYVRPVPCVRDENGEIARQNIKRLFAKINEEMDELKDAVLIIYGLKQTPRDVPFDTPERDLLRRTAEEAADTITAIVTLCEALGIDADMRDWAIRRVNEKNRRRNRL